MTYTYTLDFPATHLLSLMHTCQIRHPTTRPRHDAPRHRHPSEDYIITHPPPPSPLCTHQLLLDPRHSCVDILQSVFDPAPLAILYQRYRSPVLVR